VIQRANTILNANLISKKAWRQKIVLVYLGKRGGGLEIIEHCSSELAIKGIPHEIWIDQMNNKIFPTSTTNIKVVTFHYPHSILQLFNPLLLFRSFFSLIKLYKNLHKQLETDFFQIMPTPFDIMIDKYTERNRKKSRLRLIRLVHDAESHPGEYWPTRKAIQKRIKVADILIFFSNNVASKVIKQSQPSFIAEIPAKLSKYEVNSKYQKRIGQDISSTLAALKLADTFLILFIGRVRKYKGLDILFSAFRNMPNESSLIIAGEGKISDKLPRNSNVINRWLTDYEMDYLIDVSDLVVFPYIEASQSGILPRVLTKNKKMVVAKLPGLEQQSKNSKNIFYFSPSDQMSLLNALKLAKNAQLHPIENFKSHFETDLVQIFLNINHQKVVI